MKLYLAPMAGVTDHAFRLACRECGAEWTVGEMVSAKALVYEQRSKKADRRKTAFLARVDSKDTPFSVQLFGRDPEFLAEAAKMIESGEYQGNMSDCPPDAIDLNFGCPVNKVVSNGEGSALMKDLKQMEKIVTAVRKAVTIPVTVKMRAGWDKQSVNAPEAARVCEAAGADLITVHGRTRSQFYEPGVDLGVIAEVKRSVKVPVVGNGDIMSLNDAKRMIEETNCDGIMLARGVLGNPWLFSEISAYLSGGEYIPPNAEERFSLINRQLSLMLEEKGERIGTAEAKKHAAWYTHGFRDSATVRDSIMKAATIHEIAELVRSAIIQ